MNDKEKILRWETRMAVGNMAYDAGYYAQAVRHFRLALESWQSCPLDETSKARNSIGLAKSLAALGKYEEAESLIQEALRIDELSSSTVGDIAEDYHQLSLLYWRSGRNSLALEYAKRSYALTKKAGNNVPDELRAKLLKHFGVLAEQSGNIVEAEHNLNKAIEIITASDQLGKNSSIYGDVLLVKVLLLAEQGRFEEAAELYPQAMQIVAIKRGPEHPKVEEAISIFKEMSNTNGPLNLEQLKELKNTKAAGHHGIL